MKAASAPRPAVHPLIEQLTVDEKVLLLTGRDFWSTVAIERIGLRSMVFSDGPAGVRGPIWDERSPSLSLPCGTALGASWSTSLALRYGSVVGAEARRKGVSIVLGPTVNLQRSPLGGRNFEAISEDPVLTADLAAAFVRGVQRSGVAATPKHYVANDSETDRLTVSAEVSARALREVYLLPFERAVEEGGAWAIMSAYNAVNGVTASENELLDRPLKSEWGFDGVVVSDWAGVRSVAAAEAEQDVVMPGPDGPWGAALVEAVRDGRISEASIDRKVDRVLRLAERVGALGAPPEWRDATPDDPIAFAREASASGMVLLKNDGLLPLEPGTGSAIALIGQHALHPRIQGGGSATVVPERVPSLREALIDAFPSSRIVHRTGAIVQQSVNGLPIEALRNPTSGADGVHVRFLAGPQELWQEDRRSTMLVWFGGDAPLRESDTLELTTDFTPEPKEEVRLGVTGAGRTEVWVDGVLVADVDIAPIGQELGAAFLNPPSAGFDIDSRSGSPLRIRVVHHLGPEARQTGALSFGFGLLPARGDADVLIAEAAEAAAAADVAVVVVGTTSAIESEGFDRTDLALPGRQDDLVRAVVSANPRTVVVVNAGAPVEMPWRNEVAAVLVTWFGGQELAGALGDVLSGAREPGGRLPMTWPARLADSPVADTSPIDGRLHYREGIHVGSRAWLAGSRVPAWEFGFGLSYTSWAVSSLSVETTSGTVVVTADVHNTGARAGKQVLQVYLTRPESTVDRPVRWLAAAAVVELQAGSSRTVSIPVPARAFAHWEDGWRIEPGAFEVHVASSLTQDYASISVTPPIADGAPVPSGTVAR